MLYSQFNYTRKVISMSNNPIVFNEAEQLKLQELEAQIQGFSNFKNAVSRSLHAGQDSPIIANLLTFLHNMALQSSNQVEDLKKSAQGRADAPKEEKKAE